MITVRRSAVIEAPVEAIWPLLRNFGAHRDWHPAVLSSRIELGDSADAVGAVRAFRSADGSFLREQLIALSDRDMSLTCCLLEANVPLDGYITAMRLRRVTDRDFGFLHWEARFGAPDAQADALTRLVRETIIEAGLDALQARFSRAGSLPGHRAAPPAPSPEGDPAARSSPVIVEARPGGSAPGTLQGVAIVIERWGGPEVMVPRRVSVPPPERGEIRLRHAAIGVNMIDVHGRAGDFGLPSLPAIPGLEGAGTVLDVGAGVAGLQAGDRVVYASPPPGAYAELRTMPAACVLALPRDIDQATIAASFLKGITADLLLHDVHPLRPGETALVHAAAGGLGLLLCGWARALGARVIGVVSFEAKAEAARRAGCHAVIVSGREHVSAAIAELTGGRGVDVVYDGVGRATFELSLGALARRGHLVSYGQASGPVGAYDIDALSSTSARVSRPNFAHYTETAEEFHRRGERIFAAIRNGTLQPAIDSRWPLAQAAEAHRRLQSRQNIGSIILEP